MTTHQPDPAAVAVAIGPPFGDEVLDGHARLAGVTVPGTKRTIVWRARGESGPHPWQLYLGAWPDGQMRLLTAD